MPKKKKPPKRHEHFITTIPVLRPCSACGVWLAAGIVEGQHVLVDLVQLDLMGTILALAANVQLYSMQRTGLVHLYREKIEDEGFKGRLPEHRCGVSWPRVRVDNTTSMNKPLDTDPPY